MKISFVGDIASREGAYKLDSEIQDILWHSDYVICNLEGPIIDISNEKYQEAIKKGPHIYSSPNVIKLLKLLNVTHISLANNHLMDYGLQGLRSTLQVIRDNNYSYLGGNLSESDAYTYSTIEKEGIRVSLIAVSEKQFGAAVNDKPGFAWIFHKKIDDIIHEAVSTSDYVIMMCHMGAENIDIPLKQVRRLYRELIDKGVYAVIGGHTHMVQGYEKYHDGHIFYSIGDFCFDNPFDILNKNKEGVILTFEVNQFETSFSTLAVSSNMSEVYVHSVKNLVKTRTERLESDIYGQIIDRYCLDAYKRDFREYYALYMGIEINNEKNIEKFCEHRANRDPFKWDDMMLYHNVCIETNRWICESALQQIYDSFSGETGDEQ